jgi:hypothetical protein
MTPDPVLVRQSRWICAACGWTSRLIVIPADLDTRPSCGREIDVRTVGKPERA